MWTGERVRHRSGFTFLEIGTKEVILSLQCNSKIRLIGFG
jgi:hypothetical protein